MPITAIDTLRYARRLRDAGIPADQAEAMADAVGSELVEGLATKAELDTAVTEIKRTLRLLKRMVGFVLAFVVAIAWRVFG